MNQAFVYPEIIEPVPPKPDLSEVESPVFESRYALIQVLEDGREVAHEPNADEQESMQALEQLEDLLEQKKLSRNEIERMRALMKSVGRETWIESVLEFDKIFHYFELLQSLNSLSPYLFMAPFIEPDLYGYLGYEMDHDQSERLDDHALEYLNEPLSFINVNLLVSRLRENPALWFSAVRNPHGPIDAPDSPRAEFMRAVRSDEKLQKATKALAYLFSDRARVSALITFQDQVLKRAHLLARKTFKKIRKLDDRFFQQTFKTK